MATSYRAWAHPKSHNTINRILTRAGTHSWAGLADETSKNRLEVSKLLARLETHKKSKDRQILARIAELEQELNQNGNQ